MGTSPGRHIGAEADRRTSHDYHGPVWDPVAEVVVPLGSRTYKQEFRNHSKIVT